MVAEPLQRRVEIVFGEVGEREEDQASAFLAGQDVIGVLVGVTALSLGSGGDAVVGVGLVVLARSPRGYIL